MTFASTYTATCRRAAGGWRVHVAELQLEAVAQRLPDVPDTVRTAMADRPGDRHPHGDPAGMELVLDVRDPDRAVTVLLEAAAAARAGADRVSPDEVTTRSRLARELAGHGFEVADIATLLGVSFGRAAHLVGRRGRGPATPPGGLPQVLPQPAPHVLPRSKPHHGFRHEAFLYRGEREFLDGAVPFVRDGVERGQPVLVALAEPRLSLLRAALGPAADGAELVDMAQLGRNPARIIPRWAAFVAEHAGRTPVRGIGEPARAGRRPAELAECALHEALLNLAVDPDAPLWLMCLYDVAALPARVVEDAARSHPALVDRGGYRGSTGYGGTHHVDELFRAALPPPPPDAEELPFRTGDLPAVRQRVARRAAEAGLAPDRVRALGVAVGELAGNSLRHGGGRGVLRTWAEPGSLVCEVADEGRLDDPLAGRRPPAATEDGGRGVWLANQVSDLVQLRSTDAGTTARVHSWV